MVKWLFSLASTVVIFLSVSFYFFSSYRDISNIFEKAEKDYELNVKKMLAKKVKEHNPDEDKKDSEEDETLDIGYERLFFFLFFLIITAVIVRYFL